MDSETNMCSFIEVVHSHDILWNILNKEFKDKNKKDRIWNLVGEQFGVTGLHFFNFSIAFYQNIININDTTQVKVQLNFFLPCFLFIWNSMLFDALIN